MPQNGDVAVNKRTGDRAVFQNGQWVKQGGGAQVGGAEQRGRLAMGLGPMVQSQQDMAAIEAQGNPFSLTQNPDNAAAQAISGVGIDIPGMGINFHPFEGVAKALGGQDFQNYQQAAKSFESQLMPIMSGAAVSPSEAQRQIQAALPQLGDSPETLARKSHAREMMLNGAGRQMGTQLPYPNAATFGTNTETLPGAQGAARPNPAQVQGGPIQVNSPDEAARLPPGTVFMTPDGRRKVR